MIRQLAAIKRRALVSSQSYANLGLVRMPKRFFRPSQSLNNQFNVYVDGKAVSVDASYTIF